MEHIDKRMRKRNSLVKTQECHCTINFLSWHWPFKLWQKLNAYITYFLMEANANVVYRFIYFFIFLLLCLWRTKTVIFAAIILFSIAGAIDKITCEVHIEFGFKLIFCPDQFYVKYIKPICWKRWMWIAAQSIVCMCVWVLLIYWFLLLSAQVVRLMVYFLAFVRVPIDFVFDKEKKITQLEGKKNHSWEHQSILRSHTCDCIEFQFQIQ